MAIPKEIEWDFAHSVAKTYIPLSEGIHHLFIEGATFDPDTAQFKLTLLSLDKPEERSVITYNLVYNGEPNNRNIGTMNTLKFALRGKSDGVLAPCEVKNGIVVAEVKMSKPTIGSDGQYRQFPNIYKFEPVSRDFYEMVVATGEFSTIEQCCEGD